MNKVKLFNKLICVGAFVVLLTVSAGGGRIWAAAGGAVPAIIIEAQGGVDYDSATNTTTANTQARLTNGKITIEADLLTYNADSGEAIASGRVKVSRQDGIYQTEKLVYNLKSETGSTGRFDGVFNSQERNITIRGSALDLNHDTYTVSKGAITRCPEEKPHYTFTAKKITFQGKRVLIQGAVLKIGGIPVFYYPRLSFQTDRPEEAFPVKLESGYNATDGLWLSGAYNHELSDNLQWYLSAKIVSNRSDSDHQVETGLSGHGTLGQGVYQDTFSVNKKTSGDYKLAGSFSYQGPLFSSALDASYDFAAANKNEFGFHLTRKYWPSPVGNWRLGVQARRVAAYEGKPGEYGGVYGGYQLDYQPLDNLSLSYLRLDDFSGKNNYGDFSPNLGSTVTLGLGKDVSAHKRLNISASYNLDTQKVFGQIDWITCCYDSFIGWDATKQSVTFGLAYHF